MIYKWTINDIVEVIEGCINNKYDFVCFVEGKRGTGKSTLIYKIADRLEKRGILRFIPKHSIVYSRDDTLRLLATKERWVVFSDEMINVTYKRDFYQEQQKQIIKGLNMYRDSCNAFLGAVPLFKNLDGDMRELCKMKLSVIRRGMAFVYVQHNFTDILDSQQKDKKRKKWQLKNELKIEPTKKVGMVLFKDITKKQRKTYESIKKYKRGSVFNEQANLIDPMENWYNKIYETVVSGKLNTQSFQVIVDMAGKKSSTVQSRLAQMLRDNKQPTLSKFLKKEDKDKKEKDLITKYKDL